MVTGWQREVGLGWLLKSIGNLVDLVIFLSGDSKEHLSTVGVGDQQHSLFLILFMHTSSK